MATAKPALQKFRFNERTLRYVDSQGRVVADSLIRAEFEKVRQEGIRRALELGKRLQSGGINTSQFMLEMRDLIKSLHSVAGATARGGWNQMSLSDWGKVGSLTREQYEFLNRLGLQIEQGLPLDGRFLDRVVRYAKASRGTFENFKALMQKRIGKTRAVRVTHAKESCAGCLSIAGVEMDIDELLKEHPIGSKECQVNCLCTINIL
jgi:hypothetical protein